ncbi:MAG: hypothetical protein L6311_08010 [Cellulomonas sp.]|nr:hypothetical protein [Cellulomonas sp.]
MFVLTIDQQGSRSDRDRVPELLGALAGVVTVRAFERTVGDEVQGVLDQAEEVVTVALDLLRHGGWSIGIGAGSVRQPLPPSPREGAGEAFVLAREAVEAAKSRQRPHPVAVRGALPASADADGLLLLLAAVRARRSPQGWAAVDAMVDAGSQDAAAAALGISQQAVSKRLAAACWVEENSARPALTRLLDAAQGDS